MVQYVRVRAYPPSNSTRRRGATEIARLHGQIEATGTVTATVPSPKDCTGSTSTCSSSTMARDDLDDHVDVAVRVRVRVCFFFVNSTVTLVVDGSKQVSPRVKNRSKLAL